MPPWLGHISGQSAIAPWSLINDTIDTSLWPLQLAHYTALCICPYLQTLFDRSRLHARQLAKQLADTLGTPLAASSHLAAVNATSLGQSPSMLALFSSIPRNSTPTGPSVHSTACSRTGSCSRVWDSTGADYAAPECSRNLMYLFSMHCLQTPLSGCIALRHAMRCLGMVGSHSAFRGC